jgi:hypothetical protein
MDTDFLSENLQEREHFDALGTDGRLKRILETRDMGIWSGFI